MANENLLIGALIKYPELYNKLQVKEYMFNNQHYQNTIKLFDKLGKADLNELVVAAQKRPDALMSLDEITALRNDEYIFKSHFKNYQLDVIESYKKRVITEASVTYAQNPNKENLEYLNQVLDHTKNLTVEKKDKKGEVLLEILEGLVKDKNKVIKTGFKNLDKQIDGFETSQLNIVGGRPSMGKTAFVLAMGLNMAKDNHKVHFVSLETKEVKLTKRILSNLSGVPLYKFKRANMMSTEEMIKVTNSVDEYEDLDFHVYDDNSITPGTVRSILSRDKSKTNIMIIDYVQLMNSDEKFKDRRLELESISRQLKIIAKETDSVIIALAQLNRGVEQRQDKRPMMSDLKEAGGLEQDADMIMMLYRDDYYNKVVETDTFKKSEVDCLVVKNKDGDTGTIKTEFYKTVQRFF